MTCVTAYIYTTDFFPALYFFMTLYMYVKKRTSENLGLSRPKKQKLISISITDVKSTNRLKIVAENPKGPFSSLTLRSSWSYSKYVRKLIKLHFRQRLD